MWQGVDQQFGVDRLFIVNFQTLNCLQFKPKLFLFFKYCFPTYRNTRENAWEKKEKSGNVKKICLPGTDSSPGR